MRKLSWTLLALLAGGSGFVEAHELRPPARERSRSLNHLLNPVAGRPYTPAEIERIRDLRSRFPRNALVPTALDPEEAEALAREVAAEVTIARKMTGGSATLEEIDTYYAHKERLVRDRLELVEFVLLEPGWNERIRARYARVRDAAEDQLEALATRRLRSIKLYEARKNSPPPRPPLAAISPRMLQLTQGDVARFEGRVDGGVLLESLIWGLPTGSDAEGPSVAFSTKGLPPGVHDVVLRAVGATGERSMDFAVLDVRRGSAPALDLGIETIEIAAPGVELDAKAQIYALARNLGTAPAAGANVVFSIDKAAVHQVDDLALRPGESRLLTSPPLPAASLYDHEVTVVIRASDPEADADPDNNVVTLRTPAPGPPETLPEPAIRFDGPPLTQGLRAAPLVLNDIVIETAPLPFDLGPVGGFADLHIHQMASLGYDGRLVWGAHDGPDEATAVPACLGSNHAISWLPGWILDAANLHEWEAGSHEGLGFLGGPGAVLKGWQSDPDDSFKHWPIWRTVTHQQVFGPWLEQAHEQGLGLIVMSAVNFRYLCSLIPSSNGFGGSHPLDGVVPEGIGHAAVDAAFRTAPVCNDMRNVRRQLLAAWQFDADHDWYEIALTPGHASQIINEGKLAVVLSVEASELLDNPETLDEVRERLDYLVEDLGVRSVQPIHELDNAFGGASYWSAIFDLAQTFFDQVAFFTELFAGERVTAQDFADAVGGIVRGSDGDNVLGLHLLGEALVSESMARHLLIDVAHMSKNASDEAYALAYGNSYYPLLISHVRYSDLLTTDPDDDHLAKHWETLQQVKILGGMVGLRTGKNNVRRYLTGGVADDCPGSVRDFAQSYMFGALGYLVPQALASDMNGFIEQMRPRFADTGHPTYDTRKWACNEGSFSNATRNGYQDAQGEWTADGTGTTFDLTGFGRIDQVGSLVEDLRDNLGVETVQVEDSAEPFLQMWRRAALSFFRFPGDPCINRSGIFGGPATGGPLTPGCPIQ